MGKVTTAKSNLVPQFHEKVVTFQNLVMKFLLCDLIWWNIDFPEAQEWSVFESGFLQQNEMHPTSQQNLIYFSR
jgi:hypothetical protein